MCIRRYIGVLRLRAVLNTLCFIVDNFHAGIGDRCSRPVIIYEKLIANLDELQKIFMIEL